MPEKLVGAARPRVVIVGGGFAGLYAARSVARQPVDVTLIDKQNYHLFQPLLYQVATAALSPGDIASPIRSIVRRQKNVRVIMGEVTHFDLEGKRVCLADANYPFDYLLVAAGATGTYFGRDEWAAHAPGLKTMEDALEIRRRIFCAYETAERLPPDSPLRAAYLTFVVIGGGPTGVEMAGAIVEIAKQTLKGDFRSIDPTTTRVILLQSGSRILPEFPEVLTDNALQQLTKAGVEVRTGNRVTNITAEGVYIGEDFIPCCTTIWGAGVVASPLGKLLGVELDRSGRVLVEQDLRVAGHPYLFVAGDLANFVDPKKGQLPGIASVAMEQGLRVGKNIGALLHGQETTPFSYDDRGQLATIGRNSAVGLIRGRKVTGFAAWVLWLVVHIYFLIGFENRIFVLFNWAYSYLSYTRSARLITPTSGRHIC